MTKSNLIALTIKCTPEEKNLWQIAAGGNLSAWIRKQCNEAAGLKEEYEPPPDRLQAALDAVKRARGGEG